MRSGKKILKNAKKIIKENPEYFEALIEFENTKKLPKLKYKKRINFTIDEDTIRKFKIYCEKEGYKMSNRIEFLIKKEIKEWENSFTFQGMHKQQEISKI